MILLNKVCKYFWAACKACEIKNVNNTFIKNGIRLFSAEVQVLPKKTVRSMVGKKPNEKKFEPGHWFLLIFPIGAFGLGVWQIQRKFWKEDLIANMTAKSTLPPVDFPLDLNELKDLEYRPVRVRGKFDHSGEIYMGPRSLISNNKNYNNKQQGLMSSSSAGFWVITPFILSDRNLTILVNRGWVPSQNKNPNTRPEGQITEEVEFVGLVRHTELRKPLAMKNIPERGFWAYRDLESMSEMTGAAPILIDATVESTVPGGPIGGQTVLDLRNEHLSYIFTWFGLSAGTGFMWYQKYIRLVP